ncbi:MAG: MBL fold metallo-hydrolase [Alphaproteobacteria bacterium]|nr:MBL fold metallo-hydrolase [Alphaproteobacteria bacterium]
MGAIRVTILGCGSSGGVPRTNGDWGACDPGEPRNKRTRCGLLLQRWHGAPGDAADATSVLIDTAPDLREQMIAAGVRRLDAVVYTHDHADQAHGIDDVRAFVLAQRKRMPVWMDAPTRATLTRRFAYCFYGEGGYPPILEDAGAIRPRETFRIDGPGGAVSLTPLLQDHGLSQSLAFRFGAGAYSNDLVAMPEETFAGLAGLDLWIVDALRYTPHPTHAHLERTLSWIDRLKPRRAILTNMHIDMDYRRLAADLPAGVEPAYDGLQIDLED